MTFALLLALSACDEPDAGTAQVAAPAWSDGMWVQRAMTVGSGISEALALYRAERCEEAAELVQATYQGSFEPELEVLIRRYQGRRPAAELELSFGLLREAMAACGREERVVERIGELADALQLAAEELDRARAILPPLIRSPS